MLVNNKDGNIQTFTLIHGDCLQVLAHAPRSKRRFHPTDPPYITRYKSRDGRSVANDDTTLASPLSRRCIACSK